MQRPMASSTSCPVLCPMPYARPRSIDRATTRPPSRSSVSALTALRRWPRPAVVLVIAALAHVGAAQPSAAQPSTAPAEAATTTYTVVAGDSCLSIARRVLGSTKALSDLHRLNPQLGATPHALQPGQQLRVPLRVPAAPDANLTATRGDVEVRRPTQSAWDAAQRGMDLFRAWRVGARARSSAEVTFRDTSQLRLRENTVVVIYGPSAARGVATAVRAELEGGALEARLAAASRADAVGGAAVAAGQPGPVAAPEILTPSALATLGAGQTLVTVDAAGTSLVANHRGEPVSVRAVTRKRPRGAAVRVTAGMGSRVPLGKLPEPPRPLPAAPSFAQPQLVVATFAASADVAIRWQPVATAIRYHAVVLDEQGAVQNALSIAPGETSFTLAAVPPGAARVEVAAIDADGFEGAAAALPIQVVQVAIAAPGSAAPAASLTAATSAPAPSTASSPTAARPRTIALGSRLLAPAGVRCALEPADVATPPPGAPSAAPAPPSADDVARRPGRFRARCGAPATGDSAPSDEVLEVVAVTAATVDGAPAELARGGSATWRLRLRSDGALGEQVEARGSAGLRVESQRWIGDALAVTVRAAADAAPRQSVQLYAGDVLLTALPVAVAGETGVAPRAPRWSLDAGGFGGLVLPPAGSELGGAMRQRDQLASGPAIGASFALHRRSAPWLAARLELLAATLTQRGSASSAALLHPTLALGLRPATLGALELWTFAGAGAARLASAPRSLRPQTAPTLGASVAAVVRRAGVALHLEVAWQALQPGDDVELWPSFRLGLSSTIDR
jgi:LysM repeat protein